jgi:DNA-binding PadR family transcriptional regulator
MATPDSHIPLRSVELHILLSVVDRPRHGYAILQEAEERTEGRPGFEIPTLYRALRRLRDADLIRTADPPEPGPDERREYWQATRLGRRVLEAELSRLGIVVALGRARIAEAKAGGRK